MTAKKSVPKKVMAKTAKVPRIPVKKKAAAVARNVMAQPIQIFPLRPLGWEPVICGNSVPFADGQNAIQTTCAITSPTLRQVTTVPPGKRLVLEFAAIEIRVPVGQYVHCAVSSKIGNASCGYKINLRVIRNIFGNDLYVTSQPVLIFIDENRTVDIYVSRAPHTGVGHAVVNFSGHLESM